MKNRILFCFLLIGLFSCQENSKVIPNKQESETLTALRYANRFTISNLGDTTILRVISSTDSSHILNEISCFNGQIKDSKTDWRTPEKSILISAPHIGAYCLLNQRDYIQAVDKKAYVYDSLIRNNIDEGDILELGSMHEFNKERIITLQPDVIYYSAELGDASQYDWIRNQGIVLIPVSEWKENHPLGRAEWIKFFGAILNKKEQADSIYLNISQEYSSLEKTTLENKINPKILVGNDFKSTWYTPGGGSYIAHLLKGAGADYPWFDTDNTGSLPLDMEVVLKEQRNAPIWINPGTANSLNDLELENPKYKLFDAFQNRLVFNYQKRRREDGGNDFWETGVFHPHLILKDYLLMFHGDSSEWNTLHYYDHLN